MSAEGGRAGGVQVAFDVPARMRDGVTLRANVYRPAGPGPWPTLLTRTPYSKDDAGEGVWCGLDPLQAARAGFMVVVQDVRGRFASDGEFEASRFEREDGFDTVEWAARLPGSSGRVGMYSASYCGNTQWLAAAERPPSLHAISPALTWSEPLDGLLARGGAVELGLALRWALENGWDTLGRLGLDAAERTRRLVSVAEAWDRLAQEGYWELPLGAVAGRFGLPDLGGLSAIERPDEVAGWSRVTDLYERVEVPSLHTAGWYDIFAQGTLDNYAAMVAAGKDARLVVGPWTHQSFSDPIGELLFGLDGSRDGAPLSGDWRELQLAWLRRHLVPGASVELPQKPVRIFVMGRNAWREESGWPLERARTECWFLGAGGSLAANGPDAEPRPSEFSYDPADPVPTAGGNGVLSPGYASGPVDQAAVEGREDVLVFTSEPLREELEVTGPVRVVLHAASSAPSTDWVARLCDVHPDGRSHNLCDGIVRIAHDAETPQRVEIDLWSTSNVFLRGHRLRVHVTSSSFPRWDRNLNTGDQRTRQIAVARQRIHHAAERPSWVELPVVG
jgi:putative CocE/NonD family hydrolase